MTKVIHISEVNTEELFKTRAFMLGDAKGDWFVESDGTYLGRYTDKRRAQEHADSFAENAFDFIGYGDNSTVVLTGGVLTEEVLDEAARKLIEEFGKP